MVIAFGQTVFRTEKLSLSFRKFGSFAFGEMQKIGCSAQWYDTLPLVLNFALCANELSAQAAKSGLPPENSIPKIREKIAIYLLAVLL